MPYAVELYLNFAAEQAVRKVTEELARAGVIDPNDTSAHRPHVTLAVYEDIRREVFLKRLEEWARETRPFVVQLSCAGGFLKSPVTVFLAPPVTDELCRMHRSFHERFRDIGYRPWAYYLPDAWIPHCAVAEELTPYRAGRALEIVLDTCGQVSGTVESVALRALHPAQTLISCDLMGR